MIPFKVRPFLLTLFLLLLLSALPAADLHAAPGTSLDPKPGRYVATLSPWVAEVDGQPRMVGAVRLEGTSTGLGSGSYHPQVDVQLSVTGTSRLRLFREDGPLDGVSASSHQTKEAGYASFHAKPVRAGAFTIIQKHLPIYTGGKEPPPEGSYLWIREVHDRRAFMTLRYHGPANLANYRIKAPRDVPVDIVWTMRTMPVDEILKKRGIDVRHLNASERVRAIYPMDEQLTEITRLEVSPDELKPQQAKPPSPAKPKTAAAEPDWIEFEDVDAVGTAEVMDAADKLEPQQSEELLRTLTAAKNNDYLVHFFSPECAVLEYLRYVQARGEKLDARKFSQTLLPAEIYRRSYSPSRLEDWVRHRFDKVFRQGRPKQTTIDPDCVVDHFRKAFEARLAKDDHNVSDNTYLFNDAIKKCSKQGG